MEISVLVLVLSFIILLALNVPIAISIGISTVLTMLFTIAPGPAITTVAQQMATGINSFALLAIPFFILSGFLMGQGGIARRLIDFAKVIVGMFPGGLAYVNIVACMFFGAISGSAVAATSAIGGFMIPSMNKEGYDKNFNTALTVTASTTGHRPLNTTEQYFDHLFTCQWRGFYCCIVYCRVYSGHYSWAGFDCSGCGHFCQERLCCRQQNRFCRLIKKIT